MECISVTVFRILAMSIIFGLLLTTSDQVSDLYFIFKNNFFAGSALGIVACKHCSIPKSTFPVMRDSKICQTCTEDYGQKDGGLQCGGSALAMDQLFRFQEDCEVGNWTMPEPDIENGTIKYCEEGHNCCIQSFLQDNATNNSIKPKISLHENHLFKWN